MYKRKREIIDLTGAEDLPAKIIREALLADEAPITDTDSEDEVEIEGKWSYVPMTSEFEIEEVEWSYVAESEHDSSDDDEETVENDRDQIPDLIV